MITIGAIPRKKSWSNPKPNHTIHLVPHGKGHQLLYEIV